MTVMVGGLAVELASWLRGLFRPEDAEVAEPALDALIRYVYHAGRVEALSAAASALEKAGMREAANALYAGLEMARIGLAEAAKQLAAYDHVADEIATYLRLSQEQARGNGKAEAVAVQG